VVKWLSIVVPNFCE